MRVPTLAALLALLLSLAGCGGPTYHLVVGPKPDPILSRSVFVPALSVELPHRVLVVHPRWSDEGTQRNRSAIERGLMSRGIQVRFLPPNSQAEAWGPDVVQQAKGEQADAVLEVTTLGIDQPWVARFLVWNAKERGFVDADQATFWAASPLQRYRLGQPSLQVRARLLDLQGEKLASYHLVLPLANTPQGVYAATLVSRGEEPGPDDSSALVVASDNDSEGWGPTSADAGQELLLEALGRQLPSPLLPAPTSPPPAPASGEADPPNANPRNPNPPNADPRSVR